MLRALIPPLLACACGVPEPRVLHVVPAADGEWDDPAAMEGALAFATIQAAVDAASPGDTVSVPAGTYVEDVALRDGVTLSGAGQGETWIVGTVAFTRLTGATLTRLSLAAPTWTSGGSAYVGTGIQVNGGSATVEDVGAWYYEYGLHADTASGVTVDDSTFGYNWYGVLLETTTGILVTNSLVGSNRAGGLASVGSSGRIVHNTFVGNAFGGTSSYLTGAVALGTGGTEVVANNIMTSNYYGLNCSSCLSTWRSNLVWGNTTDYVNDASAHSSDLSGDPVFAAAAEGDFHLTGRSPCLDSGNALYGVDADADGEARPQGPGYDIGMDEYAISDHALLITEVMANPRTESTGEFVEIYNAGTTTVDLAGLRLSDGDETDTIIAFDGGATTLAPGAYAVVVDADYPGTYAIDSAVTVVTTDDANLGNGMTTADRVTLLESDGATVIASFSYPSDPGDGVSMELVTLETGDVTGNWRASACAGGHSAGDAHCFPEAGDPSVLVITEIMANAADEATGEYVELYNPGAVEVDLAGLVLADSSASDVLIPYLGGTTLLGPGAHALVVDADYAHDYTLPAGTILVTTGDRSLGNGISVSDRVTLYATDAATVIDSFSFPVDPGDGYSVEKVDYGGGDVRANWAPATTACTRGRSPARLNGAAGGTCEVLLVTEVMANPLDEDTGEFVEITNAGSDTVDLAGLVLSDGDEDDVLASFDGGTTELAPGERAVVVDAEYDGAYALDGAAVVLTTADTTLGNALSVADPVTLYEADGVHLIDAFLYPLNPGNGVSVERIALSGVLDSDANWVASTCASGSSPGAANCASGTSTAPAVSDLYGTLVLTEIMSNPLDESTGEFVEIYNAGATAVDLLYFVIWDGDALDTLFGETDPYDTILEPGGYAVILDPDHAGEYTIPPETLRLVPDDATLGSGLATDDAFYLYEDNGVSLVDGYSSPFNAGNGVSVERVDPLGGDTATNWRASACASGSSPGAPHCF